MHTVSFSGFSLDFFSRFRRESRRITEKDIFRVADKTGFCLNPRVITATKKDQGQACKNTSPVQGLSIFFRIISFALFRVFSGLNGYPHNIKFPDIIHVFLDRSVRCELTT